MALMALLTGANHVQCVEETKDEVAVKHVQSSKSKERKFFELCQKHKIKNLGKIERAMSDGLDYILIDSGITPQMIEQIIKATIDPSLKIRGPSSIEKNGEVRSLEKYMFENHSEIGRWKLLSLCAGDLFVHKFSQILNNKEIHGMEPGVTFTNQMVKNLSSLFTVSRKIPNDFGIARKFNYARALYSELCESAKTAVMKESVPINLTLDVKQRMVDRVFDTSFEYCKILYTQLLLKKLLEHHSGNNTGA